MRGILFIVAIVFFLGCNAQTKEQEKKIIGKWVSNMKDLKTGAYIGKMYVQFTPNGEFIQTTGEGNEQVVSKMTYRISNDKIYYKGKATANEEFDSNFSFKDDILIIEAGGEKTEYLRVK